MDKQPYIILMADMASELTTKVNEAITEGYEPIGALAIENRSSYSYFYQPMRLKPEIVTFTRPE